MKHKEDLGGGECPWTGQRGLTPRPQKSRPCSSPELELMLNSGAQPRPLSWAQRENPAFLLWKNKAWRHLLGCVSYRACLPSKVSQSYLCLSLSVDKLDPKFHFGQKKEIIKCQVHARCFIYFISILTTTLRHRDYVLLQIK